MNGIDNVKKNERTWCKIQDGIKNWMKATRKEKYMEEWENEWWWEYEQIIKTKWSPIFCGKILGNSVRFTNTIICRFLLEAMKTKVPNISHTQGLKFSVQYLAVRRCWPCNIILFESSGWNGIGRQIDAEFSPDSPGSVISRIERFRANKRQLAGCSFALGATRFPPENRVHQCKHRATQNNFNSKTARYPSTKRPDCNCRPSAFAVVSSNPSPPPFYLRFTKLHSSSWWCVTFLAQNRNFAN